MHVYLLCMWGEEKVELLQNFFVFILHSIPNVTKIDKRSTHICLFHRWVTLMMIWRRVDHTHLISQTTSSSHTNSGQVSTTWENTRLILYKHRDTNTNANTDTHIQIHTPKKVNYQILWEHTPTKLYNSFSVKNVTVCTCSKLSVFHQHPFEMHCSYM